MKCLITGFSGFLGSHLTDRLLDAGHQVIGIDRSIKFKNIGKHINHINLKMYHENILSDHITDLFKDIDMVFHLSALTRPQWSIKYPYETSESNVMGTIKLLEHCKNNNIKRVVFVSSSDLYGDINIYPTPEYVIPNPMNTYALSKLVCEQYLELFYKLYGLKYNIIRPFNAYGSRMPLSGIYTSAVATFINAIKNNEKFKTYGTGEQRRDFIYIDDIIDQLILVSQSDSINQVFNSGSGVNYSINEIREIVEDIIGKKMPYEILPAQYEKKETLADISKSDLLLNWKPKIDIKEGLKRTIKSYI